MSRYADRAMDFADATLVHLANRESLSAILTDRKSTRLNSSHGYISYAVFCSKKTRIPRRPRSRVHRAQEGGARFGDGASLSAKPTRRGERAASSQLYRVGGGGVALDESSPRR